MVKNIVEVVYIRHSESAANENHIIAWSPHVDLADYWKKTAKISAEHHRNELIAKNPLVITGPQLRSTRLVENLQDLHPWLNVIESTAFNEREFWIFGWRTKQEMIELLQFMYPEYKNDKDFSSWMDRKLDIPWWFESNTDVQIRIQHWLHKVLSQYPTYNTIWVITSTGIIRNTLSLVMWKSAVEIDNHLLNNKIPNLSRTEIYYNLSDRTSKVGKIAHIDPILQKKFEI
jgi:broad specificity phosphatase PhoE